MKSLDKHQFAFYFPTLFRDNICPFNKASDSIYKLEDKDLIKRIISVVKLSLDDECILFNKSINIKVQLKEIEKKALIFKILSINNNISLKPSIIYGLPLLKKESFESALYALAELGVQVVQPLITTKIGRVWLKEDYSRLYKIMISACEQAKQFTIPELKPLVSLSEWLEQHKNSNAKIFFDVHGVSSMQCITDLRAAKREKIILLSGPEGDLTQEEKDCVYNHNFLVCSLSSTILRAQQAAVLGAGIIRSFL